MRKVAILNGPNLNLLGHASMRSYGPVTLADIDKLCRQVAKQLNLEPSIRQTNHEGVLVDWIQESIDADAGIVINAGALAFTSAVIAESLGMAQHPVIEVHLSNTHKRAEYRSSLLSSKVTAVICGVGPTSYELALRAVSALMTEKSADGGRILRSPGRPEASKRRGS